MSLSPEQTERYQTIRINAEVAKIAHPEVGDVLAQRLEAHQAAANELMEEVKKTMPDASEGEFDTSVGFTIDYLYRTGDPEFVPADKSVILQLT